MDNVVCAVEVNGEKVKVIRTKDGFEVKRFNEQGQEISLYFEWIGQTFFLERSKAIQLAQNVGHMLVESWIN